MTSGNLLTCLKQRSRQKKNKNWPEILTVCPKGRSPCSEVVCHWAWGSILRCWCRGQLFSSSTLNWKEPMSLRSSGKAVCNFLCSRGRRPTTRSSTSRSPSPPRAFLSAPANPAFSKGRSAFRPPRSPPHPNCFPPFLSLPPTLRPYYPSPPNFLFSSPCSPSFPPRTLAIRHPP